MLEHPREEYSEMTMKCREQAITLIVIATDNLKLQDHSINKDLLKGETTRGNMSQETTTKHLWRVEITRDLLKA